MDYQLSIKKEDGRFYFRYQPSFRYRKTTDFVHILSNISQKALRNPNLFKNAPILEGLSETETELVDGLVKLIIFSTNHRGEINGEK